MSAKRFQGLTGKEPKGVTNSENDLFISMQNYGKPWVREEEKEAENGNARETY